MSRSSGQRKEDQAALGSLGWIGEAWGTDLCPEHRGPSCVSGTVLGFGISHFRRLGQREQEEEGEKSQLTELDGVGEQDEDFRLTGGDQGKASSLFKPLAGPPFQ